MLKDIYNVLLLKHHYKQLKDCYLSMPYLSRYSCEVDRSLATYTSFTGSYILHSFYSQQDLFLVTETNNTHVFQILHTN